MVRPFLPRLMILLAMAALLLALAATPQPSPGWFAVVAAGCLAALFDGYAGVWFLLRNGEGRRGAGLQVQVCAVWLVGTLAYFTLLNTTAQLALPGTFQWRDGPASALDVAYFTVLTFGSSGYGDILPVSGLGKALAMLTSLGGLTYATFLFTALWHRYAPEPRE